MRIPRRKMPTSPPLCSDTETPLRAAYEELRVWRHDLKHHLGMLHTLAQTEQWPELTRYLADWSGQVQLSMAQLPTPTGSPVIDALLADKLARARDLGVDTQVHVVLPYQVPLSDVEWVTMLGNLLENALEACRNAPAPRTIRLSIGFTGGMLRLSVCNSRGPEADHPSGAGIGLKQVKTVLARHAGHLETLALPDVFEVRILIPLEV